MPRPQRDPDPGSLIGHFGSELRRRRTMADLSMAQLAAALGCSPQWIGTMEQGDKPPSEAFSADLDTYFKTDGAFHHLWKSIKRAGRNGVLLPGFPRYVELEADAVFIRSFEVQLVPGLLQIEAYARALMNAAEPAATLEERVAGRMERQVILRQDVPPHPLFVLDESVLHRPIGGPKVMHEQLGKILEFATSTRVQIRVLPYSTVSYAAMDGAFTMLGFERDPDLVYVEGPNISQRGQRHGHQLHGTVRSHHG
ncbi:helix-turn-helix domain-containing protein [Actinomadura scrupuli]|uniref:helix-turn-helix domain-containing protein n=1 Tax=Actinomadura scrupuli TaxID=559629 RepID=UPI003D96CDD4